MNLRAASQTSNTLAEEHKVLDALLGQLARPVSIPERTDIESRVKTQLLVLRECITRLQEELSSAAK